MEFHVNLRVEGLDFLFKLIGVIFLAVNSCMQTFGASLRVDLILLMWTYTFQHAMHIQT